MFVFRSRKRSAVWKNSILDINCVGKKSCSFLWHTWGKNIVSVSYIKWQVLRANVSMHQTNSGKSLKFVFPPTFIFCSPIGSNNCGVVFFVKIYFSFREMPFFVRPLKYANFHREYYTSCVTSCNECTRPTVILLT